MASATVAGGEMSNADVLFSQDGWDLGSQQLCFICHPVWNGVSVLLSRGGRGGGSHRISLLLLSLSTFSIINVSSFAKFPETISRDFIMVVLKIFFTSFMEDWAHKSSSRCHARVGTWHYFKVILYVIAGLN